MLYLLFFLLLDRIRILHFHNLFLNHNINCSKFDHLLVFPYIMNWTIIIFSKIIQLYFAFSILTFFAFFMSFDVGTVC